MRREVLFYISLGVVVLVSLVGFFLYTFIQPTKYTGPVDKITVAAAEYLTGALVYIAEDQGIFEKNGLDVIIKDYQSGKACADALIADEADISTSADFVLVRNSFDHTDLRVFGTVAVAQIKELVARKDKGIMTISDLKGKKIGVTEKSGAEFQLRVFLIWNNILQQDIEFVYLKPSEMLNAILNEEVDAIFTWDPYLYNIKKELGENAISWPGGKDFYFLLLTKEDWLNRNSEATKRFMKSMLDAEDYIKDNPKEVKDFVSERFGYEFDYMDYSWPQQEFAITLSQTMLILFEDQARYAIKNNLTDATEIPNYLDYIYTDALEGVKPEAVTIIR
jgi:NitT/TauT family transport system substrate-binding protein